MTKLVDIQLSDDAETVPLPLKEKLMDIFGVTKEDFEMVQGAEVDESQTNHVCLSMMNILVLVLLIFVVTSGSTTFMVNNLVANPYLLNAGQAMVIALLYWIFNKIHG